MCAEIRKKSFNAIKSIKYIFSIKDNIGIIFATSCTSENFKLRKQRSTVYYAADIDCTAAEIIDPMIAA